ncbi:MAG: endonuclease/exonuclease/phosphatase family protein [Luteolibacter sp.]
MNVRLFLSVAFCASGLASAAEPLPRFTEDASKLRVMQWNILHGGRDDGKEEGPKRVVDVIREAKPDIVSMQETYGSGDFISKELGFHFHPRGTNVSIHTRYPVVEDISVYKEFCCSGALLELPGGRKIAFYAVWLGYSKEIWEKGTREGLDEKQLLAACKASEVDILGILLGIKDRLKDAKYADVPLLICGDFNSMSHLDYVPAAKEQYGFAIAWPTSSIITEAGFTDSYRELHPVVDRMKDRTWSPRFPEQQQDRIDYIYYKGRQLKALSCVIDEKHPVKFPSDHSALITDFQLR